MRRLPPVDRAVLVCFVGAATFVTIFSVAGDSILLSWAQVVAVYGVPFVVGWFAGFRSVALFPLLLLAGMAVGNELAPLAWSSEMIPFAWFAGMIAATGAVLGTTVKRWRHPGIPRSVPAGDDATRWGAGLGAAVTTLAAWIVFTQSLNGRFPDPPLAVAGVLLAAAAALLTSWRVGLAHSRR